MATRCVHAAEEAIRESPVVATLALFGIGLGVGVFLGRLLAGQVEHYQSASKPRMQRWMDSMSGTLPDAVRHYVSR